MSNTKLSITQIRKEINNAGLAHYLRSFKVSTPEQLMLRVLFNLVWQQASSTRTGDKEGLYAQQAIFELASEATRLTPLLYALKTSGINITDLRKVLQDCHAMYEQEIPCCPDDDELPQMFATVEALLRQLPENNYI
jgi:hypothetical protein